MEKPKYKSIKERLIKQIKEGDILPGERVPSETEISNMFGVSIITARRALMELVNEGFVYRVQGKGTFVADYKKEKEGINGRLIAFVLSSSESYDSSFMRMIKGMQSYLAKKGFSLMLEYSDDDVNKEKEILRRLADDNIRGIILFSVNPDENSAAIEALKNKGLPIVLVDRYMCSGLPVNYVASDNFYGAYNAVQYLIELGHSRIVFVADRFYLSSERERYDGFKKAMSNAGIEIPEKMLFEDIVKEELRFVQAVKERKITAVIAVNDICALKIMSICAENSISIPDELSVIGFDDIDDAKFQSVPLTTVKQHFFEMGYQSAKMLVDIIKSPSFECRRLLLPTKLIARQSTARPG